MVTAATGSNIVVVGYKAPTPVTVIDAKRANLLGIQTVGDLIALDPAFRATSLPGRGPVTADLRAMGANRTLVLVDGMRVVPSGLTGVPDLNLLPTSLISHVDVVTGGASAAYGADAVAGVVNFILDTKFTGFKSEVSGGVTGLGDDGTFKVSFAAGNAFADDRGHFVVDGEYQDDQGTGNCYTRTFCRANASYTTNPFYGTNGLPGLIVSTNYQMARASAGGVIVSNSPASNGSTIALRGIAFNPDGSPTTFSFGQFATNPNGTGTAATFMLGGQPSQLFELMPDIIDPTQRYSLFARADYELTPNVSLFGDLSYGRVHLSAPGSTQSQGNITIQSNNAFLPSAVSSLMTANGISSFSLGRLNYDLPTDTLNITDAYSATVGANISLPRGFSLRLYDEYARSSLEVDTDNLRITSNFNQAVNAVFNPANPSQIICQSSIAQPTNGCVPINLFGVGRFSQAAESYVEGNALQRSTFEQNIVSAIATGSVFTTGAGPVAVAVGGDYRTNSTKSTADPLSLANAFVSGNAKNLSGNISVTEAFGEADVPLLKDSVLAHSLSLNGAVRWTQTSISSSGSSSKFDATTWKVGAIYEPVDGVRFRVTRSLDIRAPNPTELFSPVVQSLATITNPQNNTQNQATIFSSGNIHLTPEQANTWTAGVVLRPSGFADGLQLSVDYYDIALQNAIGQLAPATIANQCFLGNTSLCSLLTIQNGVITAVAAQYKNFGNVKATGVDVDLSYSLPLERLGLRSDDTISVDILANHAIDLITSSPGIKPQQGAGVDGYVTGQLSAPSWTVDGSVSYIRGALTVTAEERFISGGLDLIGYSQPGDSGYALTGNPLTINNNNVPDVFYTNLTLTYRLPGPYKATVFGTVRNLFNKTPPLAPTGQGPTNLQYYDELLRRFEIGFRIRM